MRRTGGLFVFSLLLMLLGAGRSGAQEQFVPGRLVPVRDYEAAISLTVMEENSREVWVQLINNNPLDTIPEGPLTISRLLAVPARGTTRGELVDADWTELKSTNEVGPVRLGMYDETGESGFPIALKDLRVIWLDAFRTVGAASLSLQPMLSGRSAPAANLIAAERVILRRGTYRITLSDDPVIPEFASEEEFHQYDPYLAEHAGTFFLNGRMVWQLARRYVDDVDSTAAMDWLRSMELSARENPILRIQVSRPGIYSVSAEDYMRLGINPERIAIEWTRLYLDGEEQALFPLGRGQGGLSADTRLVFAVADTGWERVPYKTFFLMTHRHGHPPKRHLSQRGSQLKGEPPATLNRRVEIIRPTRFDHMFPLCGPTLRWESAQLSPGREADFPFFTSGADSESTATLKVHFSGRWGADSYGYEAEVNGIPAGSGTFNGTTCHEAEFELPPGALVEGGNLLVVRGAPGDRPANTAPVSFMMAEVRYHSPSLGLRAQEWSAIRMPGQGRHGLLEFPAPKGRDVPGFVAIEGRKGDVRLLDIAPDRHPRSREQTYFTILDPVDEPVAAAFTPRDSILRPERITRAVPQQFFREKEDIDYLIITHPAHREAMMPHAEYRAAEGRRVAIVTTDEVYDTFSRGQKSYRAIHQAIRHTLTQRDNGTLSHVLLVGEGSEWWWDFRPTPNVPVQSDDLPVFGWADQRVRIRGDDNYARVSGNGELADLEIGRFSVTVPEELPPIIAKIQAYENTPPQGAWMTRHVFVSDDETDFINLAEETILHEFAPGARVTRIYQHDEPYENYFRVAYRKRSTSTTRRIQQWLSRGVQTMTYIGHGGPNLWSGERILHNRDLADVDHGMRQPIIISASCDTSWVDYPTPPVSTSLGENFLRGERNGAAAVWAPVAGTSATEHRVMLLTFYRGLFQKNLRSLGTITLYSKLQFMAERRQGYVPEQFLLLGDPALRIPRPDDSLEAKVEPASLLSTSGGEFRISGTVPGMNWGSLEIDVVGRDRKRVIPHTRGRVRQGAFAETLALPAFLEPGTYEVILTAEHAASNRAASQTLFLEVRRPDITIQWGDGNETGARGIAGTESTTILRIENRDRESVSGVHIILRDRSLADPVLNVPLALEPGQVIEESVTLVLPAGVRPIDAYIVPATQATAPRPFRVVEATMLLRGEPADGSAMLVSVPPDMLRATRNSEANRTTIELPIYNLTGSALGDMGVTLSLRRGTEEMPLSGPQVVSIPAGDAPTWVTVDFAGLLPAEVLSFRAQVQRTAGGGAGQQLDFNARIPVGANLRVVPGSVRAEKATHLQGETVFIIAEIENNGDTIVEDYETQLWVYQPWLRDSLAQPFAQSFFVEQKTPLFPGERRMVRTRWDPPSTQPATVPLVLTVKAPLETDLTDNTGMVEVQWSPLPNLAVTQDRIRVSHKLVLAGDEVALTVPVFNTSAQDFRYPFIVTVDAEHIAGGTRRVQTQTLPPMRARSETVLQFRWRVEPGEHRLHINVNADREYGEASPADNEVTVDFSILRTAAETGRKPEQWNYENLRPWTTLWNLRSGVQGRTEFVGRDMRQGREIRLEESHFVDGVPPPVGTATTTDQKFAFERGTLRLEESETASPLRLRVPLWDSGTMIYDVYVSVRGRLPNDPFPSGSFRYRLEQDPWQESNESPSGMLHLGRVNTRDNFLDMEIGSALTPSRNEFHQWRIVPVKGSITSPVIITERFHDGTVALLGEFPGESSGMVFVRYGYGARESVEWSPWGGFLPGEPVPQPADGARYFQWRVDLFGDGEHTPSFQSLEWIPLAKGRRR